MYPFEMFTHQLRSARAKLEQTFAPEPTNIVPMRSANTSIMLAWAQWQRQRAAIQRAFRAIGLQAARAHNTEERFVRELISEIENHLDQLKDIVSQHGSLPDEYND